jgi:hypothetical protein
MFSFVYYKCSRLKYKEETSTFTVEVFYLQQIPVFLSITVFFTFTISLYLQCFKSKKKRFEKNNISLPSN